jgi:cytochrome b pre-mRNA-processing protein 3
MGLLQSLGQGLGRGLGLTRVRGDVEGLYALIVGQARRTYFYTVCGVPDTVGGRFDMLALHAYIVLRRLKELGTEYGPFSQALHDRMFADLDYNLREMGVGDLRVGRQIKDLAKLFYGRIGAYDAALAGSAKALEDALMRNAYADAVPDASSVARTSAYLQSAIAHSRDWTGDDIRRAAISFPDPPADE